MGRPTLIVPDGVSSLRGEHVVIGWKDTREARRAVRDAFPLLRDAIGVTIVESCSPEEEKNAIRRVNDMAGYLKLREIITDCWVVPEEDRSHAELLIQIVREQDADLLVTGAYGHSRLGEWIFGGVTRELLSISPICCLMSH
jgi:nucleotide-binding universal stress UspA family protein